MELIDKVKKLINGYYSGDFDKIYIPEDTVGEVFEIAASTANNIDQFCVFHSQMADDTLFSCSFKMANMKTCKIRQTIAFNYIKQVQQYSEYVTACPNGIVRSITILSNLELETMSDPYSFVLFDDRIAIVQEVDNDGGYFLTTNRALIDDCHSWIEVPKIDKNGISSSFLQEPLMFSADMMSEVALVLCTHDHMNMDSCYWYHSVWQYLRLMNMVSTPSWHHDFYTKQLIDSIMLFEQPNILISGAADYSSLSYAIRAVKTIGAKAYFSVLDLCETPLFACKWYAKREKVAIKTICASIFDLNVQNEYDVICTDAFLTRFSKRDMNKIISIWYKALSENGSVVTTVRIHDENHKCPLIPNDEDIRLFRHKAFERSKIWGNTINYSQEQISIMAEKYARKMKSNSIGNKDDIIQVFKRNGFEIAHLEDVEVQGELYPSRYLRIRATKGGKYGQ